MATVASMTKKEKTIVGIVTISEDVCKGCGLCVSVCPKKVLEIDKSTLNVAGHHPSSFAHPENCIACGMCAIMCPDSAIKVVKEEYTS